MTYQLDESPSTLVRDDVVAPSWASRLFGPYRELPALAGRSYLPISFLARLPATMTPVAILTFVATSSGSYAAAGLAVTATAAGSAVAGPLSGALADRRGQRAVVSTLVAANAVALLTLVLIPHPSRLHLLTLCGLIGLSMPQVSGLARARWLALIRIPGRCAGRPSPTATSAAMAYEGTADELSYVIGPSLAGLLGATGGPASALAVAALVAVVATGAFAVHPSHRVTTGYGRPEPTRPGKSSNSSQPAPHSPAGDVPALRLLGRVAGPVLAMVMMGAFFAATQSALTAFAGSVGRPAAGGLIYALMAVGSTVSALAMVAVPERIGPRRRATIAATGLVLGAVAMTAAGAGARSTPLICLAVLVTGLFVGPLLVTLSSVVGALAPVHRSATAMAFLSAGSVAGIAVGATTAGTLADADGSLGAFAVATAAVLLLATVMAPALPRWSPGSGRQGPDIDPV